MNTISTPEEPPLSSYILTVIAAFLGWTLDAFDFYAVSLTLTDIARDFNTTTPAIAGALTVSLMLRPVGAVIFGLLADKYGRRIPLMIDIVLYSGFSLASAFAGNLTQFLVIRALFGIALGGEWGLGAALLMESVPTNKRGLFSGILQQGYASGCLLATLVYYAVVPTYGWRAMYYIGASPSILVILIRFFVPESKSWYDEIWRYNENLLITLSREDQQKRAAEGSFWTLVKDAFKSNLWLTLYCVILMTAFNSFSHGSQDLYPTFLKKQKLFNEWDTTVTVVISQIGALTGGIISGIWSQRFGRRRMVMVCALLVLASIYPWSYSESLASLRTAAFFLQQVAVQFSLT